VNCGAFIKKFPSNHFINKNKNSSSGEAKDSAIFAFYFLLHKLHKPALSLRPLPPPIHDCAVGALISLGANGPPAGGSQ
jgi:hypothetical protein